MSSLLFGAQEAGAHVAATNEAYPVLPYGHYAVFNNGKLYVFFTNGPFTGGTDNWAPRAGMWWNPPCRIDNDIMDPRWSFRRYKAVPKFHHIETMLAKLGELGALDAAAKACAQ